MATAHMVTCDACGKSKKIEDTDEHAWLFVQTRVSKEEYLAVMGAAQAGDSIEHMLDGGDFCCLMCLANWASARANLREIDQEVLD